MAQQRQEQAAQRQNGDTATTREGGKKRTERGGRQHGACDTTAQHGNEQLAQARGCPGASEDQAGQREQGQGRQRWVDGDLVVRQGHGGQRQTVLPKERQCQTTQHGKNWRTRQQGAQQHKQAWPHHPGLAVKVPSEPETCSRERQTTRYFGQPGDTTPCAQLDTQNTKGQRHAELDHPGRQAVSQVIGRQHFTSHKAPTGQGQHPTHQGGNGVGKVASGRPGAGVGAAALPHQAGQVPMPLCSQCPEHGQHQAQVLHQHGRILDATAGQGPHQDFP